MLKGVPKPSILTQVTLLGCDKHITYYYLAGNLYIRLNNLNYEDLRRTSPAWVFRITRMG